MTENKIDNKAVIVLGMHRSGTSLMAGILRILGVNMGKELLGANAYNVRGYFEDVDFLRLNEKMLSRMKTSWDNPPRERIDAEKLKSFESEIEKLLSQKKGLWGWKDPATVFFVEQYLPWTENPHFIYCFRNHYDIALSLQERNGFPLTKGLELADIYSRHMTEVIKKYTSYPRYFASFDELRADPAGQGKVISEFLGCEFDEKIRKEIEDYVLPDKEIGREKMRIFMSSGERRWLDRLRKIKKFFYPRRIIR